MAELALAIAPLCLSAIKGIDVARKKLKILRNRDKEVKRLRKKFKLQTEVFLDECQLLLQEFLDPEEAESLVGSATHSGWHSPQLDEQIKIYLGRKYGSFQETISDIRDHIACLSDSLNTTEGHGGQEVKLKTSERTKEAIDVMLNKSKYDASIEGFKEANQDLKRLRKTAANLKKCQLKACTKRSRPLPSSYHKVTQHSKSFYDALRTFWSCLQSQHTSHDVRLLLDSRHDGSLRVIVRYRTQTVYEARDGLLDLLVQSQTLRLVHISMPAAPGNPALGAQIEEERPAKTRRVRFSDDCAASVTTAKSEPNTTTSCSSNQAQLNSNTATSLNLCSSGDLCTQLCSQAHSTACGGYLDTADNLRHHLYPVCDPKECFNSRSLGEPAPLNHIFRFPVEKSISVSQQVKLALQLVKGVLQFHSTPWLQPYWRLQDLSYFQATDGLAASMSTLHISAELTEKHKQACDAVMADANGSGMLDAQLAYGIRNLTMHSLGVALLQIGQWDPLRPDDIVELRRVADLAERDSRLGPRYQKITQQCLECDFGHGKDLTQIELQNAIYRDVVCELEGLVYTLEGKLPVADGWS
ncbi:uncharacterized protein BCR38DRAFT_485015 [Pseudomassariella vexata]|uniref:DUF7580 domain-containing protein n=1 Tax=Pseudomassariella vexata TaxID=1141098 RepID=A0A1Y2DX45_9PEZI|nr:uncharacterized protein BCR38DRAFT_485015 [Pseudomassariella vexata]ORY63868.1 hypothetical protein BCR38DRAFT_485015 [Pseudomassariella vexata]